MLSALEVYTQKPSAQNYAARTVTDTGANNAHQRVTSSEAGNTITDSVEISAEAQELAKAQATQSATLSAKTKLFMQFMPPREGFSATNLAIGASDPAAQPFSQNHSFEDVAKAARESMDSKYQQMADSGQSFDYNSWEGKDWYALMGDLDRRALYAVASNEGDQFTDEEVGMAKSIMSQQQGLAMGLYGGPTSVVEKYGAIPPITNEEYTRTYKAGIEFIDQVSIEEKTSLDWAMQRAGMQFGYENSTQTKGFSGLDSDNPVVKLIKAAMDNAWRYEGSDNMDNMDMANVRSFDELKSRTWFESYADRLDSAIAETRKLYGLPESDRSHN